MRKTMVFTLLSSTGRKNHSICDVFETSPSNNTSIYNVVSIYKKCNNTVFYKVLASRAQNIAKNLL